MAERTGLFTPRDCAAAFVAAVAHKYATEANAQISHFGAITAIRYQYTLEMMAEDGAEAGEIDSVYKKVARDPIEESMRGMDIALAVPRWSCFTLDIDASSR